jgi:hypothetical protein
VDEDIAVPLGKARACASGNAITLVSWSKQMQACAKPPAMRSPRKASRPTCSTCAACGRGTARRCSRRAAHRAAAGRARGGAGGRLRRRDRGQRRGTTGCRVARLGAPRIPVGYSPMLEAQSRIGVEAIAAAAKKLLD